MRSHTSRWPSAKIFPPSSRVRRLWKDLSRVSAIAGQGYSGVWCVERGHPTVVDKPTAGAMHNVRTFKCNTSDLVEVIFCGEFKINLRQVWCNCHRIAYDASRQLLRYLGECHWQGWALFCCAFNPLAATQDTRQRSAR